MKLIVRADDLGYCEAVNLGIIDCIKHGIVTTAELMVDMPGTEQAVALIKEYPAISLGLHCHYQGKACADPALIPSLVDDNGNIVMRKRKKTEPGYKPDLGELFIEYKAQLERFYQLMGHYPDYIKPVGPNADKMKQLGREMGIPADYRGGFEIGPTPIYPAPEWEHLDYYTTPVLLAKEHEKLENQILLNPENFFINDEAGILTCGHKVVEVVMHPGWLDDYVMEHSSYTIIRVKDLMALKSSKVKQWIEDNQIELVGVSDVLYGANRYQEYYQGR
ncbi:MAG: ChbG/HpnK family deacetylase [Lachnospiraceae bacterium]